MVVLKVMKSEFVPMKLESVKLTVHPVHIGMEIFATVATRQMQESHARNVAIMGCAKPAPVVLISSMVNATTLNNLSSIKFLSNLLLTDTRHSPLLIDFRAANIVPGEMVVSI